MKKLLLIVALAAMSLGVSAQVAPVPAAPKTYEFTVVKQLPITSVKNQARSGTCWCFSTISFLESELIRKGYKGDDLDLSEMFVVSKAYQDKAEKYIRLDGALNFGQGSDFGDVIETIRTYGIVPNSVMDGLNYGETRHMHSELASALSGYLQAIVKVPNRRLSTAWKDGFRGIVDAYLGACPETFVYNGKTYTMCPGGSSLGDNTSGGSHGGLGGTATENSAAYTDYVATDDPQKREDALQRHIRSVQAHVEELVKKDYSAYLRKGDSVDFVVMFIPNDPSYQAALQGDSGLWNRAFEKRILIVNPFNLMTLLYIIKVAWNRMAQERNQQEIVRTAETLLARVQRFFSAFDDVGRQLESTGKKYEAAVKALSGRQGLLGSAEKLKALGVPAKKDQKYPERFTAPEFSASPLSVHLIGGDTDAESGTDDVSALSDGLDLPFPDADDDASGEDSADAND